MSSLLLFWLFLLLRLLLWLFLLLWLWLLLLMLWFFFVVVVVVFVVLKLCNGALSITSSVWYLICIFLYLSSYSSVCLYQNQFCYEVTPFPPYAQVSKTNDGSRHQQQSLFSFLVVLVLSTAIQRASLTSTHRHPSSTTSLSTPPPTISFPQPSSIFSTATISSSTSGRRDARSSRAFSTRVQFLQ